MHDWRAYEARLTVNGTTAKARAIKKEQRRLMQYAPASLSYKQVQIGPRDGLADGVNADMLITSTQQRYAKTINMMPGFDFEVGNIVYNNGSRWLITQKDVEDELTKKGGMELCNRQLRWQDPKTLEIHERWVTTDKPYFSNIEEVKLTEVSTREFKIQVAYDEATARIDVGKRFMMEIIAEGPKTYRVTSVDAMTERYAMDNEIKGFLVINIEQDLYNPRTDNADLMIADYRAQEEAPQPGAAKTVRFDYGNAAEVKVGNTAWKKVAAELLINGERVGDAAVDLRVQLLPEHEADMFEFTYHESAVWVKATLKATKVLNSILRIHAFAEGENVGHLDVKVVPLY